MALRTNTRVVITGLGIVAPNGIGKEAFWDSILNMRSGIDVISLFDASNHPCKFAGEVKHFDAAAILQRPHFEKRKSRQDLLAAVAAFLATRDARLDDHATIDVCIGISCPAVELIEEGFRRLLDRGPKRVPAHVATSGQPHHAATSISEAIPSVRKTQTISSACLAGAEAVARGVEMILLGISDVVLCGGADAPINALTYACMAQSGLLSARQTDPHLASCPFDIEHDAGIISEGACMLVLESFDRARYRGANIYGEVLGCAFFHDFDDQPCSGLEIALRLALNNAGLIPSDIGYISAHGPSHCILDRAEAAVIQRVFGSCAHRVPASSIKGVLGNPLAAAAPMQIAACVLSMKSGVLPPTANLKNLDPNCSWDFISGKARLALTENMIVNAHGLGGGNACVVLRSC
jgi:3-oxoacyl-[acyl-carrier-protein] synthase II